MDLSMSSREDPFSPDSIFSQRDLPVVPNDNPESYCRLCLTTPDVVPLFPTDSDPNEFVLELIGKYIGIGLTIQDDSPCSVCKSCQMILDQFDLFRQNCLKVDIAIRRRRLGLDRVVKNEPQDDDDIEEVELPYIRLDNRVYKCRICSERFRSMAMFMTHCKDEHPNEAKMYKCKHCDKSFMSKTARLQHIRSHRPNNYESESGGLRVQVCEKCMVIFDSYKLLKTHIKEQHSNDPKQDTLTCTTCSRQFSRITILRNHILRVHMGKLPHLCKQCGISFGYAQQLVSHLKTEHDISPDQYGLFPEDDIDPEETMGLASPERQHVAAHAQTPNDERPASSVEDSGTEDSNRKPLNKYACMECSTQCYSQEDLRTHRKIHQDPTWWKCTHCRNFVKHREMHLQKKHPTINEGELESSFMLRFRCWMCRMYFKSLHQMEVHAHIKHRVPLPDHHQPVPPSEELEEGEIRPERSMAPPAVPSALGLPGLPMLLSQLENGTLDYLREFSRLIDPTNTLGLAGPLNVKQEPVDTSQSAMDLSGSGALNMTVSSKGSDFNSTRDDAEHEDDPDGENDSEDDTFYRLDNRTYQCKFCPEIFRHLQQIRKHTKIQHPAEWKSFKCVHCKRRFPSGPMRDRHVHFHSLNHPFKCTECDQMYRSKKRLEKHISVYHDRSSSSFSLERFHCSSCTLIFVEKKYYDLHARIYHERKPQRLKNLSDKIQVCERCVKTFDSKELLMEHIREKHQNDPPLKDCICVTCSKDMKTITLLRIHILVVHMGIMPFACQHCSAEFATRHWLLKHMEKEHSEIALFKCPSCDESFTTESRMIEHRDKVHVQLEIEFDPQSGKPVYPCGKCDKKHESKELLDKHLVKAHPTFMLMYKCPLCTQSVRYRKQHMRVHHDLEYDEKEHHYLVRYKCHCCSKLFQQKRNLLAHQNSLSNQCSRCQMRFKTKKSLQGHMAAHRDGKSLKCNDCGLEFGYRGRLEEHRKRYHSADSTQVLKILNCPYCPKLFISPSNRERHIAANHVQTEFKVNCGHCQMQATSTEQLRKHYKAEHPDDRVTFKCPDCEKFYLNLSSFKDHYKKHKKEQEEQANNKEALNSTTDEPTAVESKDQQLDVTLNSTVTKDEANADVKIPSSNGEVSGAMNASESSEKASEDDPNPEKQDVSPGDPVDKDKAATEAIEQTPPKVENQRDLVETKEEKPVPLSENSIPDETPKLHPAEDSIQDEKMKTDADKEMKSEEPVSMQKPLEKMDVDETINDENPLLEAVKQQPIATEYLKKDDLSENELPVGEKPTVEEPISNEKMDVDETEEKACDSTPEVPSQQENTSDPDVSAKTEETVEVESKQEATVKEPLTVSEKPAAVDDTNGCNPVEDVNRESESNSTCKSPKEQTSIEATSDDHVSAEWKDGCTPVDDVKPVQGPITKEQISTVERLDSEVPIDNENKTVNNSTDELKSEHLNKSAEEQLKSDPTDQTTAHLSGETANPDHENSSDSEAPENTKPSVEEAKPNKTEMIAGTTEEREADPTTEQTSEVSKKNTTVDVSADKPVNKLETVDDKPQPEIAVGNVVSSESPNLSNAPLVESCRIIEESSEHVDDPLLTEKSNEDDTRNGENAAQHDDKFDDGREESTTEEPAIQPACSQIEEGSDKPGHMESKPQEGESKKHSVDEKDFQKSATGKSAECEDEHKPESPTAVIAPQEPAPLVQNNQDDPPPDDLRSANNSPVSTIAESPYTIVETSNEASEVSESSAVSERSTKRKKATERQRISTRNILKRKRQLVVLLEPVDIDKLMELSRGSSSSSSASLDRVAMKGSGGSSNESQPSEDGVRAKRLRRERRTPTSDTVGGDS